MYGLFKCNKFLEIKKAPSKEEACSNYNLVLKYVLRIRI